MTQESVSTDGAAARCPICERRFVMTEQTRLDHPFCGPRCRQVDLVRWLDGRYAIVDELPLDPEFLVEESPRDDL